MMLAVMLKMMVVGAMMSRLAMTGLVGSTLACLGLCHGQRRTDDGRDREE
jgi:hypothetical protein